MGILPAGDIHKARRSDAYWLVIPAFNEGATDRQRPFWKLLFELMILFCSFFPATLKARAIGLFLGPVVLALIIALLRFALELRRAETVKQ